MQEIILDRYLTGFVFEEGGSDTQYLEENSSLINSLPICHQPTVCGLQFVKWATKAHAHTSGRKKIHNRLDQGREDYPGKKSRKKRV